MNRRVFKPGELEIHEATSTRRGFDVQTVGGKLIRWNLPTREAAERSIRKLTGARPQPTSGEWKCAKDL